MAINTQKFLPSYKSTALAKVNKSLVRQSTVSISETSQKNIDVVKVKVIEVDKLLKGTLASEKKELDDRKKKDSQKRREDIEQKLETKPKASGMGIKMPTLPRMGFLDWIKNFIGNVILGFFAVRLVDHLPKLIPIVRMIGKATDFAIDLGGKLLNGLVTFVDWGYKAYDSTKGFVKNLFGDSGVKQFEQLSGLLNQFLNLALIAGMVAAGSGRVGGRGSRVPSPGGRLRSGTGGRPKVTTSGGQTGIRNPFRQRPKVTVGRGGNKVLLSSVRPFLKRIPLPILGALVDFGLSWALGEDPGRAAFRAIGAGLLGVVGAAAGSVVPVAGNFIGGLVGGVAGDYIGGALYDMFFGGKVSTSKASTIKKAGGGITRGGKTQGRARRTIKRGTYKRKIVKKPGDVEITSPGSDVGGKDKLFGLFPNPFVTAQKVMDMMNPFKVIQNAGKNLGESDYFGPILAITAKILLGQKPSETDYKNVGLGINLLVSKGIDEGQLKGGLAAAFAEGGFVDPKALDAISQGGDISDWVAKSFKDATETNAQKTLREIQENLRLQKTGEEPTPTEGLTTEGEMPVGTGSLVGNTNAEKVFNFLKGAGFTDQAAAGVIGNLMQESGVNPKSKQLGGGPGRGIMQWGTGPGSGGRWDALVAWASSSGKDPWALDTQVQWMMKEMRSYGTLNRLKGVTDVKKAVQIFEREMEKAGIPNYPRRYQYAADALASFGSGKAGGIGVRNGGLGLGGATAGPISTVAGIRDQQNRPVQFSLPAAEAFGRMMRDAAEKGTLFKSFDIASTYRTPEYNRKIGGANNSKHTKGLAADIHGSTGAWIRRYGAKYGWVPNDYPGTHGGHYEFKGTRSKFHGGIGIVPKDGLTLKLHKGEMFKVVDKDSVDLFGKEFVQDIIDIENKSQLIAKAPSIIERLKVISGYAPYENEFSQTVIISPQITNNLSEGYTDQGSSILFSGTEEEDPFEFLYSNS